MSGLKITRIATGGRPLSGGYALDASYSGDDVDVTTGLPLDGLLDVNAPAPDDDDVLTWDDAAGEWIAAPASGGPGATALDDLTDVNAPAPNDQDVLTWDDGTSAWIAAAPTGSGLDVELVTVAAAGASEAIDVSVARTYDVTLTADCNLSLTGAVTAEAWYVSLWLRQDGTGGWDVTWPASIVWMSGTAPVIDPDPAAVTVVTLATLDGGTSWLGFPANGGGTSTVTALDDLTDVAITSPSEGHAIRYRSGIWRNELAPAPTRWEIVVADGGSGPSGVNVSEYVEMTTQRTTTSATLVDITGCSTTITIDRVADIAVWLNCEISASGAPADLGLAISIDGTDHDTVITHLAAGGSDSGVSSVVHRTSSPLAAGTYTFKGRMKRAGGAGTPAVDRADMIVMSMGQSGPDMITTDDESDYLYAEV